MTVNLLFWIEGVDSISGYASFSMVIPGLLAPEHATNKIYQLHLGRTEGVKVKSK